MIWNPWKEIRRLRADNHRLSESNIDLFNMAASMSRALNQIIAEEKPTSNATVKRIVRMAREATNGEVLSADPIGEQMALRMELGISLHDDEQAWLRLHQLLKSHEDRIAALEGKA